MPKAKFPLEKVFGSRTRVKIIALFTTGVKRPYYVREIARHVDERLNAVRRELDILQKIGFLETYLEKRRKYYTANQAFVLFDELASIMQKTGPAVEDSLFKNLDAIGDIDYVCLSGVFTKAETAPTDLLIVGQVDEKRLAGFIANMEKQLGREITYTPMTSEEYTYRRNFNDLFLRQIFSQPHKELINNISEEPQAGIISAGRGKPLPVK